MFKLLDLGSGIPLYLFQLIQKREFKKIVCVDKYSLVENLNLGRRKELLREELIDKYANSSDLYDFYIESLDGEKPKLSNPDFNALIVSNYRKADIQTFLKTDSEKFNFVLAINSLHFFPTEVSIQILEQILTKTLIGGHVRILVQDNRKYKFELEKLIDYLEDEEFKQKLILIRKPFKCCQINITLTVDNNA